MPYKNDQDRRDAQYRHRQRNRIKLWEYLETHPCVECGETHPATLDFDHIDPSIKSFDIGRAVAGSHRGWDSIYKEIQKCQVMCANCHRKKTAIQFDWYKNMQ